jgi:F-type H+-transporting ATPase subunit gamma
MNTQIIRRRIRSITNTSQITKAMEMVAASKMKKAQEATLKSRSFASLGKLILGLLKKVAPSRSHRLLKRYPEIRQELIIVITSNKGLCGAFNIALLKRVLKKTKEFPERRFSFITIGKKGRQFLTKNGLGVVADFSPLAGGSATFPNTADILPIVTLAQRGFLKKDYQKVSIAYTDFISTLKQIPRIETILPISQRLIEKIESDEALPAGRQEKSRFAKEYKFEPGQKEVLDFILPRLMEVRIYQAILESLASEHSARMMAMKNATDNAKEIIKDLTLTYNGLRQASITQELSEITAGVEAMG